MKRKNPETSNEAYRSLKKEEVENTYAGILKALSVIKSGTFEDIALQMNVDDDIVWKRLSELKTKGKIFRPGEKKVLKSGRMGYIWALVVPGKEAVTNVEKLMPGESIADWSRKLAQQKLF